MGEKDRSTGGLFLNGMGLQGIPRVHFAILCYLRYLGSGTYHHIHHHPDHHDALNISPKEYCTEGPV